MSTDSYDRCICAAYSKLHIRTSIQSVLWYTLYTEMSSSLSNCCSLYHFYSRHPTKTTIECAIHRLLPLLLRTYVFYHRVYYIRWYVYEESTFQTFCQLDNLNVSTERWTTRFGRGDTKSVRLCLFVFVKLYAASHQHQQHRAKDVYENSFRISYLFCSFHLSWISFTRFFLFFFFIFLHILAIVLCCVCIVLWIKHIYSFIQRRKYMKTLTNRDKQSKLFKFG